MKIHIVDKNTGFTLVSETLTNSDIQDGFILPRQGELIKICQCTKHPEYSDTQMRVDSVVHEYPSDTSFYWGYKTTITIFVTSINQDDNTNY